MKSKLKINGTLIGLDYHFTRQATIDKDELAGDFVAGFIGDLYLDYHTQSPVEQWTQVMKALRVHGFQVSLKDE